MIFNCDKVSETDIDYLNDGLRGSFLNPPDAPRLADYFGVSIVQARRWFAGDGQQYRRMIVLPPNNTSPFGLRPFLMFDEDDPQGFGDANKKRGAGRLQSMRLRVVFAAAFGNHGEGFNRDPLFTGQSRIKTYNVNALDEAIHRLNAVYTGNSENGRFMRNAWTRLRIIGQTPPSAGWIAEIKYNLIDATDGSDPVECPDVQLDAEESLLYRPPLVLDETDET